MGEIILGDSIMRVKREDFTGQRFERGDYVHFKGNEKYAPYDTYVWFLFEFDGMAYYIIEHPDGVSRKEWINPPNGSFEDGFEAIHSRFLDKELKYIQIYCHPDFQCETDELVLLKKKKNYNGNK